jgi:iron(III) transport system ATP-binding protein
MADRTGVMREGRLKQVGTPEAVFHMPATTFVAQFVGIADFIEGRVENGVIVTILGEFGAEGSFSEGDIVKVLIRPDFIDIEENKDGEGVIVERVFQGVHHLYTILLPSGETVRCLQHHDILLPLKARVRMKLRHSHRPLCFLDEPNIRSTGKNFRLNLINFLYFYL